MKKHGLFHPGKSRQSGFDVPLYNPETQEAVVRCSICTGERVAGFRDKKDGRFTEVMLLRSREDEQAFKEKYRVDKLKVEY